MLVISDDVDDVRSRFSVQTLITILLTHDPSLSIDALQSQLQALGLSPTRIAVASLRNSFLRHFELLREAGLLIESAPRITTRSTQSKGFGAK